MPDLPKSAEEFIGGCILSRTCHWPTNDSGDEVENATLDQWASVYHSPTCIQTRQRRREALAAIIAEATAQQAAEVERLRAALKLAVEFVDRVQQFGRLTRADAVAPGPMEMSAAVLATTLRAALAATPVAPAPSQTTGRIHGEWHSDDCRGERVCCSCHLVSPAVAPAPNSAPNPPAPHRCRECDDGPNLSFPEPTHAPPAPGERCDSCNGTRWVDDENASPSFSGAWRHGRRPSDGLIPCGACNEGGWDAPWQPAPGDEPDPTTLLEPAP